MTPKRRWLERVASCIPCKTLKIELPDGARVRFYQNSAGKVIQLTLSRKWKVRNFDVASGFNLFQDLSGGFRNYGSQTIGMSSWASLLRARHQRKRKGQVVDFYWNDAIKCVVIRNSENDVLVFTPLELLEIARVRRSLSKP